VGGGEAWGRGTDLKAEPALGCDGISVTRSDYSQASGLRGVGLHRLSLQEAAHKSDRYQTNSGGWILERLVWLYK